MTGSGAGSGSGSGATDSSGGEGRVGDLGVRLGGLRRRGRAGELAALRRAERLLLQAGHLFGVRTSLPLELEVLFDGVVEQSHLLP